jgi:hypothetical protein
LESHRAYLAQVRSGLPSCCLFVLNHCRQHLLVMRLLAFACCTHVMLVSSLLWK